MIVAMLLFFCFAVWRLFLAFKHNESCSLKVETQLFIIDVLLCGTSLMRILELTRLVLLKSVASKKFLFFNVIIYLPVSFIMFIF